MALLGMWGAGCILAELYTGQPIFSWRNGGTWFVPVLPTNIHLLAIADYF